MVIVAGNNIGSGCGQYVSNALRNNTSLTTLELSIWFIIIVNVNFGEKGAEEISLMLLENNTLRSLSIGIFMNTK